MSRRKSSAVQSCDLGSVAPLGTRDLALAIIPVVLILLPGILEFGSMLRATIALEREARSVARMAADGAPPRQIVATVKQRRGAVDGRFVECDILCNHRDPVSGRWCGWRRPGSAEATNDAAVGDRIIVRLTYDHVLLLGGISRPGPAVEDGSVRLDSVVEVLRK